MKSPKSRGREMGAAAATVFSRVSKDFHLLSLWLNNTPDNPDKAAKKSEHPWDQPIPQKSTA